MRNKRHFSHNRRLELLSCLGLLERIKVCNPRRALELDPVLMENTWLLRHDFNSLSCERKGLQCVLTPQKQRSTIPRNLGAGREFRPRDRDSGGKCSLTVTWLPISPLGEYFWLSNLDGQNHFAVGILTRHNHLEPFRRDYPAC